jgi:DNA-binding transcriptional ArsR family regulator
MTLDDAASMLAAIGHPIRLQVFRTLVQAGPSGLAAGDIARSLDIAPSSLNFHLRALQQNLMITSRNEGRFVIYAARFEAMSTLLGFLTDNCCGGNPCMPISAPSQIVPCSAKPKSNTLLDD